MSDLTKPEQDNVRRALSFLRARIGSWAAVGAVLETSERQIMRARHGGSVTATLAYKVARVAGVGVDAVLAGTYAPEGYCPHCGKELEPKS